MFDYIRYHIASVGSYYHSRKRGGTMPGRGGGSNLEMVKTKAPTVPYVPPADFRETLERLGSVLLIGLIVGFSCFAIEWLISAVFGG